MSVKQYDRLPSTPWQLRFFGEFSVRNPEGHGVRLPDRKVEGLLAILALHPEYGIERSRAAEILWPGRAPSNLATLRQALSVLRRALGEDAIEASRQHCRLTSSFAFASDFEQPQERRGGFMPGLDGEWFEEIRLDCDAGDGTVTLDSDTIVASFHQTLLWFAAHDRRGLHNLLRARPSLTRGIAYTDLLALIRATPEDDSCVGWSYYWRGTAEDSLDICAGLLRSALREAKRTQSLSLASEACLELGKVYSRSGKVEQALRICDIADGVAAESNSRANRANAVRLRGTVQVHWQDTRSGLNLLREAERLLDDPIEIAVAQGARAFFEASAGMFDRAAESLSQSQALSRSLNHYRIGITAPLTAMLLRLSEGARTSVIAELAQLGDHYRLIGSTQFGVYSDELLSSLLLESGELDLAESHFRSAQRDRLKSNMTTTLLETKRVRQFA